MAENLGRQVSKFGLLALSGFWNTSLKGEDEIGSDRRMRCVTIASFIHSGTKRPIVEGACPKSWPVGFATTRWLGTSRAGLVVRRAVQEAYTSPISTQGTAKRC